MVSQARTTQSWILTFDSSVAAGKEGLALVGGKGANLARLAQAGFPVPNGFFVTTQSYLDFVFANHLEEQIQSILTRESLQDPDTLEALSSQIRTLFAQSQLPPELAQAILEGYRSLENSRSNFAALFSGFHTHGRSNPAVRTGGCCSVFCHCRRLAGNVFCRSARYLSQRRR